MPAAVGSASGLWSEILVLKHIDRRMPPLCILMSWLLLLSCVVTRDLQRFAVSEVAVDWRELNGRPTAAHIGNANRIVIVNLYSAQTPTESHCAIKRRVVNNERKK